MTHKLVNVVCHCLIFVITLTLTRQLMSTLKQSGLRVLKPHSIATIIARLSYVQRLVDKDRRSNLVQKGQWWWWTCGSFAFAQALWWQSSQSTVQRIKWKAYSHPKVQTYWAWNGKRVWEISDIQQNHDLHGKDAQNSKQALHQETMRQLKDIYRLRHMYEPQVQALLYQDVNDCNKHSTIVTRNSLGTNRGILAKTYANWRNAQLGEWNRCKHTLVNNRTHQTR